MRITAQLALLLGCSAQGILDGQVFTHALFGIGCGAVAVACGFRAARQRRSPRMSHWFLAGGGAALVLICTAMLPSSYRSQIQFNRVIERRIQTGRSKGTANKRLEPTATCLSVNIGCGDRTTVASLIYALVRPEPRGFQPLKGTVASPADPKLLAGHYYEGDGTAHRELDLNPNMTYTMELWGCFGSDGRSTGTWSLTNSKVVFAPAEQTGVLARPRKELSVLLFRNHWVLLSDEEHYQKFGVSRFSCFQNTNFIYWGP